MLRGIVNAIIRQLGCNLGPAVFIGLFKLQAWGWGFRMIFG